MNRLYVLVGPSYSGMGEFIDDMLIPTTENLQIIEEYNLSNAMKIEGIATDENIFYGFISSTVRAHLIKKRNVVAFCDNLSIDTLVMWRKMASEHGAQCVIILFKADQEHIMLKIDRMNFSQKHRAYLQHKIAQQFKQYDDLEAILVNKFNTITRDLADVVLMSYEYPDESREE